MIEIEVEEDIIEEIDNNSKNIDNVAEEILEEIEKINQEPNFEYSNYSYLWDKVKEIIESNNRNRVMLGELKIEIDMEREEEESL